jgi:D-3-phosphoglycerate dehydrogenase
MMAVARNVGDADKSIKDGKWERGRLTGIEAKGKVLGIIGLGKGTLRFQEFGQIC